MGNVMNLDEYAHIKKEMYLFFFLRFYLPQIFT